jgi:hypothetical protein
VPTISSASSWSMAISLSLPLSRAALPDQSDSHVTLVPNWRRPGTDEQPEQT